MHKTPLHRLALPLAFLTLLVAFALSSAVAHAEPPASDGTITPLRTPEGATQHVAISTPGKDAHYSVEMTAGELISLKAVNSTFDGRVRFRWLDSSGTALEGPSSSGFANAYISRCRFDKAGTYTLEIDPEGEATGSLDLKVWDATSPDDLTLATSGEGSSKTFAVEAPGELTEVHFRAIRGQEVQLDASEASFEGWTYIRGPRYSQVASGLISSDSTLHRNLTFPESGIYTIYLYAFDDHTGSVRLTASADEADELTGQISITPTGTKQHVEFESSAQLARYTVPVKAGEWVSMVSSGTALGSGYRAEWIEPSGNVVQTFIQPGERDDFFERVRFAEAGDATLVVAPEDGAGSVDLTLYDASDRTARIATGEARSFTLDAPRQQYLIEVDGYKGEQLEIVPSEADFEGFFHLQTPSGEYVSGSTGHTKTNYWSMTLPEAGTYTIVLTGNGAAKGSVTLEFLEAREDEDLTGTITPLATPEGALQHVAIAYSHQNARYSVAMNAGERVALKPTNSTFNGPYEIRWKNAEGQTVYRASWNTSDEWFWSPHTFAEGGTYTLEVDPEGSTRGSTDLRVWDSSSPEGLALDTSGEGSSKVFDVNAPGERLRVDLAGNAGERLSIRAAAGDLEGEFHLLAPDGSWVANAEGGLTERHGPFLLPETGTYTIVLALDEEQTGSVRLTVKNGGGFEVIPGTIIPSTAGTEQHVEFTALDQKARYTVPVTSDESVSLVASNAAIDPGYRLEWFNQNGEIMRGWSSSEEEDGFLEPVRFYETGDATLVVTPEDGVTGSVDLTVYDASDETGQIAPGEVATFSIAAPGQQYRIGFGGTEDHRLTLVPSEADFEGEFHLQAPSGEWVEGSGGDLTAAHGPVILPENGPYTVVLTGLGAQTGSVSLEAIETEGESEEVDGTITPLATPEGALQHVAITSRGRDARYSVELSAGEKVALKTTGSALDGAYEIRWLDPDGQTLYSGHWEGREDRFWSAKTFADAGTYTLVVDPEGRATGSVDLRVWEAPTLTGQELELSHEGDSVTSTIEVPGQAEAISFDGEAGRSVRIAGSESTFEEGEITLMAPGGYALRSTWIAGAIEVELPEDGTYVVLVEGRAEATGSVVVELRDDTVEDITGQIEPTASGVTQHVEFSSPSQVARYTVPVAAGESVSMTSGGTALGSLYRVEWLNPSGEVVQAWYPSGESDRFFEAARFGEAGDATLVIAPEGGVTGSVDLTLYDASDETGQIAPGEAATFSIAAPGQQYRIELDGTEGEGLSLTPTEATFEGEFHLQAPSGEWVEGSGGDLTAIHGPVMLPETGTYTVVLNGNGAQTGSVVLEATKGEDLSGTITPLATPEGALQHVAITFPGQKALYSVEMTAGEKVALKTTESAFDGAYYIRWRDESGSVLYGEWWNGGEESWFCSPVTFAEAGTYTLELDPEGSATGSVDLKLWEDPTLTGQELEISTEGDSVTSTIEVPGQAEEIGFLGKAGDPIQITTSESTFEEGEITLMAPGGYALQSSAVPDAIEAELPEDGTYTILVEDRRGSTGSVLIELRDLASEGP